jgi:hypothetical protein
VRKEREGLALVTSMPGCAKRYFTTPARYNGGMDEEDVIPDEWMRRAL